MARLSSRDFARMRQRDTLPSTPRPRTVETAIQEEQDSRTNANELRRRNALKLARRVAVTVARIF